ncbi:hypothetical protein, partial [Streptomyces sp. NPDC001056]
MNAEPAALTTPSALSSHDLFYVHLDERQCSVTLGFTTQQGHEAFGLEKAEGAEGSSGYGLTVSERRKPPHHWCGGFPKNCSAASYSPTGSPLQY